MNNILGMALAILLGNTTNCLTGWATSRFGLFGTTARPPKNDVLNYIGLVMVLIGYDIVTKHFVINQLYITADYYFHKLKMKR
jgi:uncharacterized membrane protein YdcZ (DUF606 family)